MITALRFSSVISRFELSKAVLALFARRHGGLCTSLSKLAGELCGMIVNNIPVPNAENVIT